MILVSRFSNKRHFQYLGLSNSSNGFIPHGQHCINYSSVSFQVLKWSRF